MKFNDRNCLKVKKKRKKNKGKKERYWYYKIVNKSLRVVILVLDKEYFKKKMVIYEIFIFILFSIWMYWEVRMFMNVYFLKLKYKK